MGQIRSCSYFNHIFHDWLGFLVFWLLTLFLLCLSHSVTSWFSQRSLKTQNYAQLPISSLFLWQQLISWLDVWWYRCGCIFLISTLWLDRHSRSGSCRCLKPMDSLIKLWVWILYSSWCFYIAWGRTLLRSLYGIANWATVSFGMLWSFELNVAAPHVFDSRCSTPWLD